MFQPPAVESIALWLSEIISFVKKLFGALLERGGVQELLSLAFL